MCGRHESRRYSRKGVDHDIDAVSFTNRSYHEYTCEYRNAARIDVSFIPRYSLIVQSLRRTSSTLGFCRSNGLHFINELYYIGDSRPRSAKLHRL
eukprot:IDg7991t1